MFANNDYPAFVQKRIDKLVRIQDVCPTILFFLASISLILFLIVPPSYLVVLIAINLVLFTIISLEIYIIARKKLNRWKRLADDTLQARAKKMYYYDPIVQMQKEYDEWLTKEPANKEELKLKNDWLKMLREEMKRKAQMIEKF